MASAGTRTTIVSVGYEQRSAEQVVNLLKRQGVSLVVDVRLNPVSRKKGLSKTSLETALKAAGIQYRHEAKLGNPKDNREAFRRGVASARNRYQRHLENGASSSYREVMNLAQSNLIALLCYERAHADCHRSCILDAARDEDPSLEVLEL